MIFFQLRFLYLAGKVTAKAPVPKCRGPASLPL